MLGIIALMGVLCTTSTARAFSMRGEGDNSDYVNRRRLALNTAALNTTAPTTASPTTPAPTAAAPTTPAPTTAAPTTPAPTTPAPTTAAPTTSAPTTAAPTTPAPTTQAPTTTANTARYDYTVLGPGGCRHVNPGGSWSEPPSLFRQTSKAELQRMCDKFKGCIAFEFETDNSHNSLRFSSVSALEAAAKSSGWGKWNGQCQLDCKITVTTGDAKRQCWVKDTTTTTTTTPKTQKTAAANTARYGYIELGRGECHHVERLGKWSRPPALFKQASKAELRQMCDKFKGCIAFEFNNDTKSYNSLRFRSVSALEAAASKSSGWDKWEGECQSHCKVKVTTGDANRGCWVKDAIPVPTGANFLGGDGVLQQDRRVKNINLPTDFEIGFDILPNPSTVGNMSSIVTFTNGRDFKAEDNFQIRVTFLPNSRRLMVVDGPAESAHVENSEHWSCNNSVLTLRANEVSRVQLVLQQKSVSVYVNGKVACWNITRQDRKALNNAQVYLSDPYLPAAHAAVADLYLWQLQFAGQQTLSSEICPAGSPSDCRLTIINQSGYSAKDLIRVYNGRKVQRSTEKHSCPADYKIWSPRSKADWTIVYNAMGQDKRNYPRHPDLIIDVTRPTDKCGGCTVHAMNSNTPGQRSWRTTDGSPWWLRDSPFAEPNGDYTANCYMEIEKVHPDNVEFNDKNCDYHSTDYLCQPITTTMTTTTMNTTATKAPKQSDGDGEDHPRSWTTDVAIGVTLAVLLAIAIVVLVACVYWKRHKQDKDKPSNNGIALVEMRKDKRVNRFGSVGATTQFWEEEDDNDVYRNPAVLQMLRRNLYSINLPPEELQVPPLPIATRTFASSNYRTLYETARCFADTSELLIATKHLVRNFVRKQNRQLNKTLSKSFHGSPTVKAQQNKMKGMGIGDGKDNGRSFFHKLVDEASRDASVWQDLSGGAELLWTSGKKSSTSGGVEFCGIVNAAIREDNPLDLLHLVMIARGINDRVVHRGEDAKAAKINELWAEKFPKDGIVYRGGAFDNAFQSFFVPNKKYRVPGYLATSLIKKVAVSFALRAREGYPRILWRIAVDKRGIEDPLFRCRHAFVLEMTHIPGEEEYLFVPYSTFTVLETTWSENHTTPHEILVEASVDNVVEADDLPLAPWY